MPATINLALCGIAADGTRIYGSPQEAAAFQISCGMAWLIFKHPQETFQSLALGTIAATCFYLVRDAGKRDSQKSSRAKKL